MVDTLESIRRIGEEIDFEDLIDPSNEEAYIASVLRDASSGGTATHSGILKENLQSLLDNYADSMNKSAIAKSTGLPVQTSSQQYKGFAAEEHFKHSLKIDAAAKGVPDYKMGVYTSGPLPDGTVLSHNDMHTDIAIVTRKHPWSKPMKTTGYQAKIHNRASAYAKDLNNPQYKVDDLKFVGGSGQGANDRLEVKIGKKTVYSDSGSPEDFVKLADQMKAQSTPRYSQEHEKVKQLNEHNLGQAVVAGAATGLVLSVIKEVVDAVNKKDELSEEQFVQRIERIICGTVEGGIRGGAIAESVQLFGMIAGKEIASNTFEAIPPMAMANFAVDFGKDLYKCFVTQSIDKDELLNNSVESLYSSVLGFGGACVVGKVSEKIVEQFSLHAFSQGVELLESAKAATSAGAAIGSPLGPIGTVVGSVVGGLVFSFGAKTVIGVAKKDAETAFNESMSKVMEISGIDQWYYFADTMESLTDFRLSFKDLIPCYNLISDLDEYTRHKQAIKNLEQQMKSNLNQIDTQQKAALDMLIKQHQMRLDELTEVFAEQEALLTAEFQESVNTYIASSYVQFIELYGALDTEERRLNNAIEQKVREHSYLIDYMLYRNEINARINLILNKLMEDEGDMELLSPFIDKIIWFMQQDELLIGRQFISFEEAISVVRGGAE